MMNKNTRNEHANLIKRLEQACNDWEKDYAYGVIPISIVRGIIRRYDEVSRLNNMYYGD